MRGRLVATAVIVVFLCGCGSATSSEPKAVISTHDGKSVSAAAAPTEPAAPVPQPVAVVPVRAAPPGPPRKQVKGDGIQITETSDGRVQLRTTTRWGEALDTTYSDCTFYLAAIPVLRDQLSPARAKLLSRVCAPAAPPSGPVKRAPR